MAISKEIAGLLQKIQLLEENNHALKERVRSLSVDQREQSFLIESLMERTPFGLMLLDADRQVIRVNRAAESILNIQRNTTIGRKCEYFFDCYKHNDTCPVLDLENNLDRVETKCTIKGYEEKTLLRSSVLIKQQQENILIEAFIDISEIKQARDAIINTTRTKDEFLAKMSHELRTPLNAIIGYTDLLKDYIAEIDSEKAINYLGGIDTAGHKLLHLVDELLDISRIIANKIKLDLYDIEVRPFIDEIEKLVKPLMDANNNRLSITVSDDVTTVYADQFRLRQILYNLISNACKFTSEGDISINIRSGVYNEIHIVEFSIKDTGIGMTSEQTERIFNEFEQADNTVTRKYDGMGIGLSIARQLSRLMNGYIHVCSESGIGTTFTLAMPAETPG